MKKLDKETYETCLNIANGCHDYNGGHHGDKMNSAFHHGIQTVINCLEALEKRGLDDLQLNVVYEIGKKVNKK